MLCLVILEAKEKRGCHRKIGLRTSSKGTPWRRLLIGLCGQRGGRTAWGQHQGALHRKGSVCEARQGSTSRGGFGRRALSGEEGAGPRHRGARHIKLSRIRKQSGGLFSRRRPPHTSRESPVEAWFYPGSSIRVFGEVNVSRADGSRQRLLCMA